VQPGVFHIPFPYWHQLGLPVTTSEDELVQKSLYQLDLLLKQQSAPNDTAAILLEPVLGEGGYVPAPACFLQGLRDICDQNNILLIIDEVQCGFGRTGKYFYIEDSGVKPDIMVVAKGLANGFPLSGVISRTELTDNLKPGSLGGTYAGTAVSCAAAVAVVDVMRKENILDNVNARWVICVLFSDCAHGTSYSSQTRSKELFDSLNQLRQKQNSHIVDVRGKGLMIAVEFSSPSYSVHDTVLNPSAPKNLASRVAKRCIEKGLLLLTTSVYEVIRFIPPLNISQSDLKKGCEIFAEALEEVVREG
jgi:4-aminobutyrate aminotransferase